MALTRHRQWTGAYTTQFQSILPGGALATQPREARGSGGRGGGGDEDEDEVDYSFVTGGNYRVTRAPKTSSDQRMTVRSAGKSLFFVSCVRVCVPFFLNLSLLTVVFSFSPSSRVGDLMASRTFKGASFEASGGPAKLEMGLSGIARHYNAVSDGKHAADEQGQEKKREEEEEEEQEDAAAAAARAAVKRDSKPKAPPKSLSLAALLASASALRAAAVAEPSGLAVAQGAHEEGGCGDKRGDGEGEGERGEGEDNGPVMDLDLFA